MGVAMILLEVRRMIQSVNILSREVNRGLRLQSNKTVFKNHSTVLRIDNQKKTKRVRAQLRL